MDYQYYIYLIVFLTACNNAKVQTPVQAKEIVQIHSDSINENPITEFELQVIQNEDKTWGYDILMGGRQYIHQAEMPAVGGNKGFVQERQARQVGQLVLEKLKQGIMPPSISAEEVNKILLKGEAKSTI
jgi:hypothetical protein